MFAQKVYEALRKVPRGKVITYKQLAKLAGKPKAYRAVGNILSKNPDMVQTPCHRVIKSNGEIGGYVLGKKKKAELLRKEGMLLTDKEPLRVK